jgi:hypothetical protein
MPSPPPTSSSDIPYDEVGTEGHQVALAIGPLGDLQIPEYLNRGLRYAVHLIAAPGWWRSGAVVGGFIIGGVLVASAMAQRRATDDAIRSCAEDFPGFDPHTGTFVNDDGEPRVCPYLY